MPFRLLEYKLWMLEWLNDRSQLGSKRTYIIYYLWKPPKISSPWGMFLSDTAHVGEYSRKAKPSRYDISTRTVRIFFNPNPRIFSSQRTFLVDFPTRLSGEDTTHYRNWRIAIGKLFRRRLLLKLNILNDSSQNRSSRRDRRRISLSRNSIFYALIASKFYWPIQNARSNCG